MKSIVKLCVIVLLLVSIHDAKAQMTEEQLTELVLGEVISNYVTTDYFLDISDRTSLIEQANESNDSLILKFEDWLMIYHELKQSAIGENNNPDLVSFYEMIVAERLTKNIGEFTIPIGVIIQDYDVFLPNALADGLVYIDNNGYTIKSNSNPLETKKAVASTILVDTLYGVQQTYIDWDDNFIFSQVPIEEIWLRTGRNHYLQLNRNEPLLVNLISGINIFDLVLVLESRDSLLLKSEIYNKDLDLFESKSGSPFTTAFINGTVEETFFSDIGKSAGVKIFYGCNNTEKKLARPIIVCSGYNPVNIETFKMLIDKFNSNGLLDEFHYRNYDLVVVRFNNGTDRIEPGADILIKVIQEVNNRKFLNNSFHENLSIGYSQGSLTIKTALKKMEVEFAANPIQENLHHTKLYISYDGELQGANIPLAAQHSLVSLSSNPPFGLAIPGLLIQLLNNMALLNSGAAKDFLIYHYTQTGTASSPTQNPHPNFAFMDNFKPGGNLYFQGIQTDKHGGYPLIRNIAVAQGSANTINHPLGQASGGVTLEIDRERGNPDKWFSWYRKDFLQWRAVDGSQKQVFKRTHEKKPALSNNFQVILEEDYRVSNNSIFIDAVSGSTMNLHKAVKDISIGFMFVAALLGDINVNDQSSDCFVPTVSALDIQNHNGNFVYNLRDNNLMWEDPDVEPGEEQEDEVGYPSIVHGANQYAYTPFDGLFCHDNNEKHGASDENIFSGITDFILSEVHYEDIWLQFLTVGAFADGQFHPYPAQFEAINTIACGEEVTFKTQNNPFICAPMSNVELKAGDAILFKPGTHLQSGSAVHAYIESSVICPKSLFVNSDENDEEIPSVPDEQSNHFSTKDVLVEKVTLYPNPNEGKFAVENPFLENINLTIFDGSGKIVFEQTIETGKQLIRTNLVSGFYFVRVGNKEYSNNFKIIIK